MEASDAEVILAKVVGGQTENGRVKGIELEGGRVLPCDVAVLCMGPWTGRRDHSVCFNENVQSRVLHGGVSLELALEATEPTGDETNPVDQTKPLEIHSVTFRLPPDHTVDATALFLSACPVKCNDPEV